MNTVIRKNNSCLKHSVPLNVCFCVGLLMDSLVVVAILSGLENHHFGPRPSAEEALAKCWLCERICSGPLALGSLVLVEGSLSRHSVPVVPEPCGGAAMCDFPRGAVVFRPCFPHGL